MGDLGGPGLRAEQQEGPDRTGAGRGRSREGEGQTSNVLPGAFPGRNRTGSSGGGDVDEAEERGGSLKPVQ